MSTSKVYFTKDHEWIKVEGNVAYIGITDYAQKALGEIVYVELPEVDSEFSLGDVFSVVESVKAASDIFMPVDGKVVEVNEALSDEPEKINQDANDIWIMAVELENSIESYELMSESEYIAMYEKEA
ncbi:glycine cleavage complex lipoylprotein [Acetoanaerobium sticklandii]|uniref:Glycine cleavage system H protein n=1 Tax=Acetoanaerobium sticklandii (strain ATCC 12662 / DSM 519 / JCM 1433 / CCUG 9281 / NCIMB 10654 / HF) TaxID=499177 RepID=E3PVJ0_ACESD|nr:glycine cleavage system protein GcvH [Acetoanaerobium sticklandii]CBH20557.1 glycine cleavage complex lipoylprotein [Acetoanaerobium sticklandii]